MALFDKYARLRKVISPGSIYSDRERILDFLEGRVTRQELPALVVEPATVAGVQACVRFAIEKELEVEPCSGLSPKVAVDLGGKMLLSTLRLIGASNFLGNDTRVRVAAGVSIETLQMDLDRHSVQWPPLFPRIEATSIAALVAKGWQGIRNWRHGGTLAHLAGTEWVDGEGELRATGTLAGDVNPIDVLPILFGSRGELGILTRVELLLEPNPTSRTACMVHLAEASAVIGLLSEVGLNSSPPDIVYLLDAGALEILRRGTEIVIPEETRAMVVCEWTGTPPEELASLSGARWFEDAERIDKLWAELFTLESVATQLYPARLEGQIMLPARAFTDFEARARAVSYEASIAVALCGTVEVGHLHIWVLSSEDEPRLKRRASEVLEKLQECAVELGGGPVGKAAAAFLKRRVRHRGISITGQQVRTKLKKQLDPHAIFGAEETI